MNLDITTIAQKLVDELAAEESAARLKTQGVVALYERIQEALATAASSEVSSVNSGPEAEKAASIPEATPDAGSTGS